MAAAHRPCWNLVALIAPFLGFLCGSVVLRLGEGRLWSGDYYTGGGFLWTFGVWTAFCVLGLIAASIAVFRHERFWGVTLAGFLLNAPLPLLVVYFVAVELLFP